MLDEDAEAYDLVNKLLAEKAISLQDWNEWPLLQGVRQFEAESGRGPLSKSSTTVSNSHDEQRWADSEELAQDGDEDGSEDLAS